MELAVLIVAEVAIYEGDGALLVSYAGDYLSELDVLSQGDDLVQMGWAVGLGEAQRWVDPLDLLLALAAQVRTFSCDYSELHLVSIVFVITKSSYLVVVDPFQPSEFYDNSLFDRHIAVLFHANFHLLFDRACSTIVFLLIQQSL